MKFEKDRLGYAFEGDYPESYDPKELDRLRTVLQQQIGQLGAGAVAADDRLLGILIGRRSADAGRAQIETRDRPGGQDVCLVARGEVVLPADAVGSVRHLLRGFAQQPSAGNAVQGPYLRLRQRAVAASEVDKIIDACAARKVAASPNYLATLAAVSKGVGGPEPVSPPPVSDALLAAAPPAGEGGAVSVAVIDTGIPREVRGDGWLADVDRTEDNIDALDLLPAGPDGLLDYQAGHGTFVAGVIRRVAPQAKIRMYRAADSDGFATDQDIADAILQAHDDGAQIINLSLGARTVDNEPPPAMAAAVATVVRESGGRTVIVAAAGNFGDESEVWPAGLPGVAAVAGLTSSLTATDWSSRGPRVRFSTVGEGIRSTYVPGTESPLFDPDPDHFGPDPWALWSGTSFAAPQVAGAVARISYESGVEPRRAVEVLEEYGAPVKGFGKAMRILQGLD
jgi:subtilisin family serine protease